jgi:cleavage stimulation factor subunit 3
MVFVWTNSAGKQEEVLNALKASMEVNLSSFLLHFPYAEMQEACKEYGKVNNAFNKILNHLCVQLKELEFWVSLCFHLMLLDTLCL